MIAEVAAYYPGMLSPDLPWPIFRALHQRAQMFESRAQLRALLGTGGGITAAFGGETSVDEMLARAYPVAGGSTTAMIENLASRKRQEDGDG